MATKKNTSERREKGTGTIYQRGDSWVGKIDIGVVDGKRKFKYLVTFDKHFRLTPNSEIVSRNNKRVAHMSKLIS